MGVLKSMRDLRKQAEAMEQSMGPTGDRLAAAQQRMANLSQVVAAQAQAANAAAAAAAGLADGSSVRRKATITGMRQLGTVNFDLLVEFDVTVLADGMPPYPATAQQTVTQFQVARLAPGVTLDAAVSQANPSVVWLDLSGLG